MGLYITATYGAQVFGGVMLLNLLAMAITQPPLAKKIAEHSFASLMGLGYFLTGLGFLLFALHSLAFLLLGTLIMTMGQSILFLRADLDVLARIPKAPAMAFGIQRLSIGIGGMLAGLVGGYIYAYSQRIGRLELIWVFVGLSCFAGIVLIVASERSRKVRYAEA